MSSKYCTDCNQSLPLDSFYKKSETRHDRICKSCKKSYVQKWRQEKRSNSAEVRIPKANRWIEHSADQCGQSKKIEENSSGVRPYRMIERNNSLNHVNLDDYSVWDEAKGFPLTEDEKIEIRHNINSLGSVLLEILSSES